MAKAFLIFLTFLLGTGICLSQTIKVMTYNIRYANPGDGENRWSVRKEYLANQIKFYEPDIFGIQEGLKHQVDYLDSGLRSFTYAGIGRDDGKTKGEYSAIYFNINRFDLVDQSTFWLSETPEKPSIGWDAAMERICTYALLRDKETKKHLWIFNTHFDHIGELARENSAKLIIEKINQLNVQNYPVVFMGDLNLEPESKAIKYLSSALNDTKNASEGLVFGPTGTFNGFNWNEQLTRRIDYIFTDKENIKILKYAVLSDSKEQRYPSDHLPVYVELTFNR